MTDDRAARGALRVVRVFLEAGDETAAREYLRARGHDAAAVNRILATEREIARFKVEASVPLSRSTVVPPLTRGIFRRLVVAAGVLFGSKDPERAAAQALDVALAGLPIATRDRLLAAAWSRWIGPELTPAARRHVATSLAVLSAADQAAQPSRRSAC